MEIRPSLQLLRSNLQSFKEILSKTHTQTASKDRDGLFKKLIRRPSHFQTEARAALAALH